LVAETFGHLRPVPGGSMEPPMSEYTERIEEVARRIDGAKEYL
jgi:hypothetical protein